METTHNSVKVKLGIKVMKLVESLIGREVTVGQGSECHLTFVRGLLHIAQQDPRIDHKTTTYCFKRPQKEKNVFALLTNSADNNKTQMTCMEL